MRIRLMTKGREASTQTLTLGTVGIFSSFGSFAVSLSGLEAVLRVGSLAIGMAVGIATFISILKRMSK